MSIHKSLRISAKLARSRNVWTRKERLEALTKAGKYKKGDSVFGIPKVRTSFKVATKGKK